MIRVAIADDHSLIRDGFKKLISNEEKMSLAGEAKNAEEAVSIIKNNMVDVLVLDLGLPDKNGLELLKDIQVINNSVRILVLSMYSEKRYAKRAFHLGAAGYIKKEAASEELIEAIKIIYSKGRYVTKAVEEILTESFSAQTQPNPHETLSDREYQLLLKIGQGKTVKEIAAELGLSINTIHSYRKRLLKKMDLHTDTEIVQYTLRHDLAK